MLLLFLLNTVGFYGIFLGMQLRYAREANKQLDDGQYSASDAMTFKVPLSVPYASDNQEYQRVAGEFEHRGEVYRLVKQKLYHDTLYIVCVKDRESKKINQALDDYVKTFTDKPVNAKQQNNKLIQSFIKDFLTTGVVVETQALGWNKSTAYRNFSSRYFSFYSFRIKYPPKSILST